LALGDALAAALLALKGFSADDFALRHPGGALGKRLLLRVTDIMHSGARVPLVATSVSVQDALFEMTGKGFGVTGIIDDAGVLVGILTDGDLRRLLAGHEKPLPLPVVAVMTKKPKTITEHELAASALKVMEDAKITSLFVVAAPDIQKGAPPPIGIIHLHDLLRAGVI
jgi:arabinose-5-phosphate isomerase